MPGLCWTYNQLAHHLRQLADPPSDINPVIKKVLTTCPGSYIWGLGGHSVVLWISSNIVAKVSLQAGDERLRHEQDIFALLDRSDCPHLVQCFFRGTDVTFLELLANGTLYDRMSIPKPKPILRWMLELSSAAACLEDLGFAHGDINPQNILLDAQDHLRLIDFDHSPRIGDALDVGYEPYVRQHREFSGGVYGIAGPVTEQFALGSVFWYITRNSELYSELEGSEQVDRLLDSEFPATDPNSPVDRIIRNCWNGRYRLIADIVDEIMALVAPGAHLQRANADRQKCESTRLCERYHNLIKSS